MCIYIYFIDILKAFDTVPGSGIKFRSQRNSNVHKRIHSERIQRLQNNNTLEE